MHADFETLRVEFMKQKCPFRLSFGEKIEFNF